MAKQRARDAYQNAVRLDPGMVDGWKQLTELLLSRGETNAARLDAQRCIQLEPGAAASHLLMGAAHFASKDYPRAREEFSVAARLAPRDPWPHARLAKAWAADKHRPEAEKEYQLALALQPDNSALMGEYLDFLLGGPRPDQAVERARAFADAHSTAADAQRLLATVLVKREKYAEAEIPAQHAVSLDPRMITAYVALGDIQHQLGRTGDALATYNRALAIQPNYAPLITLIGNLYIEKNDLDSARKSFEQALAIDPNFAVAEANLAWVCAQQNLDLDHALSLAQKARQQMPAVASIADTLGWVNYKKGNYLAAKLLFQDCVHASPKQASYRYHLGLTLLASGDRIRAKAELQNALRLKLSGDPARDARETLEKLH